MEAFNELGSDCLLFGDEDAVIDIYKDDHVLTNEDAGIAQ
jgi:hypothetical protein